VDCLHHPVSLFADVYVSWLRRQASITAHEVRALSASWEASKGVALGYVLELTTWSNHSTFSQFYLRDCSILADGMWSIGPDVAAQHMVWEGSPFFELPSIHRSNFCCDGPPLLRSLRGPCPVSSDWLFLRIPALDRGFSVELPHTAPVGGLWLGTHSPIWLPCHPHFDGSPLIMIVVLACITRWIFRPADRVNHPPRMVAGVGMCDRPTGLRPYPLHVRVTPSRSTHGLP
jgi:hypothetical protein